MFCVWTVADGAGANFEVADSELFIYPWLVYFDKFYKLKDETIFSGTDIGVYGSITDWSSTA